MELRITMLNIDKQSILPYQVIYLIFKKYLIFNINKYLLKCFFKTAKLKLFKK